MRALKDLNKPVPEPSIELNGVKVSLVPPKKDK